MKAIFCNDKISEIVIDSANCVVTQTMQLGGDGIVSAGEDGELTFTLPYGEERDDTVYYRHGEFEFFISSNEISGYSADTVDAGELCVQDADGMPCLDDFVDDLPVKPDFTKIIPNYAAAAARYIKSLPKGTKFYLRDKRKADKILEFFVVLPEAKDEVFERAVTTWACYPLRELSGDDAVAYLAEAVTSVTDHQRLYDVDRCIYAYVLTGDTRPLTRVSHYSIVRLHDGHEMPTRLFHDYDTFAEAKAAIIEQAEQYCYDNDLSEAEAAEFMKDAKYCCSYIDDVYSVFIAVQFEDGTIKRVDSEAEHAHK